MNSSVLHPAELHDTQEQHGFLAGLNLSVQIVTDRRDDNLRVKVVTHLIDPSHVCIEVYVSIDVPDPEMMTQIAHEHIFCPRLIYLFFLAEQCKQAKETGQNNIGHRCISNIFVSL